MRLQILFLSFSSKLLLLSIDPPFLAYLISLSCRILSPSPLCLSVYVYGSVSLFLSPSVSLRHFMRAPGRVL